MHASTYIMHFLLHLTYFAGMQSPDALEPGSEGGTWAGPGREGIGTGVGETPIPPPPKN